MKDVYNCMLQACWSLSLEMTYKMIFGRVTELDMIHILVMLELNRQSKVRGIK